MNMIKRFANIVIDNFVVAVIYKIDIVIISMFVIIVVYTFDIEFIF